MKKIGFALVLISILTSCSKENTINSSEILGIWSNEDPMGGYPDFKSELLYHFESEKNVTIERIVIMEQTNEIVGYRYRAIAKYSLKGDDLIISNLEIYNHDESKGLYSDLSNLELSDEVRKDKVSISFEDSFNQLNFHYEPCGSNENCISLKSFIRKN